MAIRLRAPCCPRFHFLSYLPTGASSCPDGPNNPIFDRVNRDVIVRLKWGETEYKGRLVSIDSYLNIQLSGAEEYIGEKLTGSLGEVLIR